MSIQAENRREAYYDIQPKAPTRRWHIVQVLKMHPNGATAEDILQELLADGIVERYSENAVRPRLCELCAEGIIEAAGKAKSPRTGKSVTVWRLCK